MLLSCSDDATSPTTGIIQGVIFDANDNSPVANVMVTTNPSSQSVLSNANGEFVLQDVLPGNYTLIAEKSGYEGRTLNIRVHGGKTAIGNFLMTKGSSSGKRPYKPTLVFPRDRDVVQLDRFNLSWSCADPGGESLVYSVYFGTSATSLEIIETDIPDTSCYMKDLQDGRRYFWQVLAKNRLGLTSVSDIGEFVYEPAAPEKPTAIYPMDMSIIGLNKVLLQWACNDPSNLPLKYRIHFGTRIDDLNLIADNLTVAETQLLNLMHQTKYYWQVTAINSIGKSRASDIFEFTCDTAHSIIPDDNSLIFGMEFNGNFFERSKSKYEVENKNVALINDRKNKVKFAANFSNNSSYLKVAGSGNLHLSNDYTIAFWMKYNKQNIGAPEAGLVFIISKYGQGGAGGASYAVGLNTEGKLCLAHYIDNNSTVAKYSASPLPDGEWTHVCITYSSTNAKFYINGKITDVHSMPKPQNTIYNLYLGACYFEANNTANRYFSGSLDDLFIFNRVLSDTEINNLLK